MTQWIKWMVPAVAVFALTIGLSAWAADNAKGSISGKVLDKNGSPVADVEVRLMRPMQRRGQQQSVGQTDAIQFQQQGGPGQRPAPLATTKTNDKGEFSFKDVEPGEYRVSVTAQGKGFGRADAKVEAGKDTVVEIKLSDQMPGRRQGQQ